MKEDIWKELRKQTTNGLINEPRLDAFLAPVFPDDTERMVFKKKAIRLIRARRMLLRAFWYTDVADKLEEVRQARPALRVLFLIAMAEGVSKLRTGSKSGGSERAVQDFFSRILEEDKKILRQRFKRNLGHKATPRLRFSSIIKILYEIRSAAVHGEEFYMFSLLNEEQKKEYSDYNSYSILTYGKLGKRGRKKPLTLNISLTYEDLRDIFRRTAIENIKAIV